jgi:hypothetical protein
MRIAGVACARNYAQLCITFHDSARALTSQRQSLRKVLIWPHRASLPADYGRHLRIEVSDDGAGPPSSWQAGFGLISMRERAAELGGSCEAGPAPDGGGRVTASLLLGQSTAELAAL